MIFTDFYFYCEIKQNLFIIILLLINALLNIDNILYLISSGKIKAKFNLNRKIKILK